MKFLLLFFLLLNVAASAQKPKVDYFIYDKDWNGAKDVASAEYVVQQRSIGDSLFVVRIFKGTGYLWRQESYKDADQKMPHGQFAWYDDEGRIDSAGFVNYKKKDGYWTYYNDTMGVYLSIQYENGREVERKDYTKKLIITAEGEKTFDAEKQERDSITKIEKVAGGDDKEAKFKGGAEGYKRYLERNLVPPTNLNKNGTLKAQFIINKDGKIENLMILRSVQLSADIEAIRVLSEMPEWTPAFQNGHNVKYQAIQYITFQRSN